MKANVAISSWSGGKDSCLACYRALNKGVNVGYLLNFISRDSKRGCFHGIESRVLNRQAELIGIPLVQEEVSPDMEKYENEFKAAVGKLMQKGPRAMVFGDIYLDEHRSWVERVCQEIKIRPIEPLWGFPAKKLMEEFIDYGFKAVIVSCKADVMGEHFLGRQIDRPLISELEKLGVCPCGENGEFHTLVVDGPIFKQPLEILESRPVLKEGFWKHWFLDIVKFR